MAKEILSLQNLSKYYTSAQSVVVGLSQISLTFSCGEFVAITGESGSGKSTLAHVLGGILPYESGELLLNGNPTSHYDGADWERYRRDYVSFISQSYGILPGNTVMANVVSALRLTGIPHDQAREQAEGILRRVELWELRGRRAAKLSSGQKQRLSIARALAKPSSILIADEPTGNLDAENSAKVISLLAEAAQERLVILITHEFSEAENYVTRHISLHDGRVTMDAQLREQAQPAPDTKPAPPRRRRNLSPYVAGLQLRARPVWSLLMLCFFTLTVFGVFAFAGTFISSLDDTFTRLYDDSAFPNGDSRRIVVCKPDGSDMTPEDEAALLAIPHVEALERYSYLNDIKYAYRQDVDYVSRYTLDWADGAPHLPDSPQELVASTVLQPSRMPFARTIPRFSNNRAFLTAGRLPETIYEVVAEGDQSMLGQVLSVYLQDPKNWGQKHFIYMEVTVVGITDYGSGLYFHDDVGRMFLTNAKAGVVYMPDYGGLMSPTSAQVGGVYIPGDDGLEHNELLLSEESYSWYASRDYTVIIPVPDGLPAFEFFMRDLNNPDNVVDFLCVGYHLSTHNKTAAVSPDMFEQMTLAGQGDQISLTMEDYAYTDRVLNAIYELGYAALSPCREGSTVQDPELAEQRMQTLRICAIALVVLLALQIVVLRAMFNFETETYRLLSNIGLDCKTARLSIFWQVLLFTLCGQALGLLAILACGGLGLESIGRLLRYLPAPHRVLLSLIHLAACLVTALWIMRALERQVYPNSGNVPDLDWNALDEEAEK